VTMGTPIISKISNTGVLTLPTSSDTLVGRATTDIFTNKRITRRCGTIASAGTITPTSDDVDEYIVTAQGAALTIEQPSGTPTDAQTLILRLKDDGTARAITWHTGSAGDYRFSTDLAAPTTTIVSKTLYCGFLYNSTETRWDCLAILNNF
jgi:hypothetical protein